MANKIDSSWIERI